MPVPLSMDLRERFARLVKGGVSGREAAHRLQLSAATGTRWARDVRACGSVSLAPMGHPRGTGKLSGYIDFFQELLVQDPDITLFELCDALNDAEGICVRHTAISRLLKRCGLTHKKSRWLPPSTTL